MAKAAVIQHEINVNNIEESKVKIEMVADNKIKIAKTEPNQLTTADPKFLAAAQRAKDKYAKTLWMLKKSDQ